MPPEDDNFRFPRQEKIKSSLVIRQVMENGVSLFAHPIKCYYRYISLNEEDNALIQVSVTVSKRRFRHAVDRNRIKRLMREAYRLQKCFFPARENETLQMCWVFVGKELPTYNDVFQGVGTLAAKLSKNAGL